MKTVVVHRSARDSYEVARAMEEAGLLERLVTDLYSHHDTDAGRLASQLLPAGLRAACQTRYNAGVPSTKVTTCKLSGIVSLAMEKAPVPFSWRRKAIRWSDDQLGRRAGLLASKTKSTILSYSYYAHSAFRAYTAGGPSILFQLHPHPVSMRRILQRELLKHPECSESLSKEWELSLPEQDFKRLVQECAMADHWIAASSFTRQTLIENGIDGGRIHVAPYGVDLEQYRPGEMRASGTGPLRLLFTGTINQRKGIKYLTEALRMLNTKQVELRVCGRVVDDLSLFEGLTSGIRITPLVSRQELIAAYQTSDLFVLPSVAEGFGQVLLESLACGTPILSTTRTAAPDLIVEGQEGFVVPAGEATALAQRIEWAMNNRRELREMRHLARMRAEHFSWERFRARIAAVVRQCTAGERIPDEVSLHV